MPRASCPLQGRALRAGCPPQGRCSRPPSRGLARSPALCRGRASTVRAYPLNDREHHWVRCSASCWSTAGTSTTWCARPAASRRCCGGQGPRRVNRHGMIAGGQGSGPGAGRRANVAAKHGRPGQRQQGQASEQDSGAVEGAEQVSGLLLRPGLEQVERNKKSSFPARRWFPLTDLVVNLTAV